MFGFYMSIAVSNSFFGHSAYLSSDGIIFAIGTPNNRDNVSNSRNVRCYWLIPKTCAALGNNNVNNMLKMKMKYQPKQIKIGKCLMNYLTHIMISLMKNQKI